MRTILVSTVLFVFSFGMAHANANIWYLNLEGSCVPLGEKIGVPNATANPYLLAETHPNFEIEDDYPALKTVVLRIITSGNKVPVLFGLSRCNEFNQ